MRSILFLLLSIVSLMAAPPVAPPPQIIRQFATTNGPTELTNIIREIAGTNTSGTGTVALDEFTVAQFGDLQNAQASATGREYLTNSVSWLIANKTTLAIKAVVLPGDLTDSTGTEAQWLFITNQLARLSAAGIPVYASPGNHDQQGSHTAWNTHMGSFLYAQTGFAWSLGANDYYASAWLQTNSSLKMIFVGMGYPTNTTDFTNINTFARTMSATYPDYVGVFFTHGYLSSDGIPLNTPDTHYEAGINGIDQWNLCFSLMQNCLQILCGHDWPGEYAHHVQYGNAQNRTDSMFFNEQDAADGGANFIRLYRYRPLQNTVNARVYNTLTSAYVANTNADFVFPIRGMYTASMAVTGGNATNATFWGPTTNKNMLYQSQTITFPDAIGSGTGSVFVQDPTTKQLQLASGVTAGAGTVAATTFSGQQFGVGAAAGSVNSIAVGSSATAGAAAGIAIGLSANATPDAGQPMWANPIALGSLSESTGDASIAAGYGAKAYGQYGSAFGEDARAQAQYSTAIGGSSVIDPAHVQSTAIGFNATTTDDHQIMIGTATETVKLPGIVSADGPILTESPSALIGGTPAENELPSAGWIRELLINGYVGYSSQNLGAGTVYGATPFLFTNAIPPTWSRVYNAVIVNQYIGAVGITNLTSVQGPIVVSAYLSFNTGGGRAVSIKPEIYYSYDNGATLHGDWDCGPQVITGGVTNRYDFVVTVPYTAFTNTATVYRVFKIATQNANPNVVVAGGTAYPSQISYNTLGSSSLAQTPWITDINAANKSLTNLASLSTAVGFSVDASGSVTQGTSNALSDAGSRINGMGVTNGVIVIGNATPNPGYAIAVEGGIMTGSYITAPFTYYPTGPKFMQAVGGSDMTVGGFVGGSFGVHSNLYTTNALLVGSGFTNVVSDAGSAINGVGHTNGTTYQGRTLAEGESLLNVVEDSTTHSGVKIGMYRPMGYSSLAGIWFNESAPDASNYSFLKDGGSTFINANFGGNVQLRAGNSTVMAASGESIISVKPLIVWDAITGARVTGTNGLSAGTNSSFTVDDSGNVTAATFTGVFTGDIYSTNLIDPITIDARNYGVVVGVDTAPVRAANRTAIIDAVTAITNSYYRGGSLSFPNGVTYISGNIYLPAGVMLRGQSRTGTVLAFSGVTNHAILVVEGNSNYYISPAGVSDLRIYSADGRIAYDAINVNTPSYTSPVIENVLIDGGFSRGVYLNNTMQGRMSHVLVDHATNQGFVLDHAGGGFVNNMVASSCFAQYCGNSGFYVKSTGSTFLGCAADSNTNAGWYLGTELNSTAFIGCTSEQNETNQWLIECDNASVELINCGATKGTNQGFGFHINGASGVNIVNPVFYTRDYLTNAGSYAIYAEGNNTNVNFSGSEIIYQKYEQPGVYYSLMNWGEGIINDPSKITSFVLGGVPWISPAVRTNLSTLHPNFDLPYSTITTNDAFTWLAPINAKPYRVNQCVVFVTNSAAAYKAVTPPANTHAQGVWAITNVTAFTFSQYGNLWTNAIALPMW